MFTSNSIDICGDPDRIYARIYQLAAEIQDWPELLSHYRSMRVLECSDHHKIADFGASRDGFPCKWRARQELFPSEGRITYIHIRGITTGMRVEWRLERCTDRVRVTIDHELNYPVPVLGPLFARYIVGNLFIHNIAGKTLRGIKQKVEAERMSP